jgi:hypothetical protein
VNLHTAENTEAEWVASAEVCVRRGVVSCRTHARKHPVAFGALFRRAWLSHPFLPDKNVELKENILKYRAVVLVS